MKNKAIRNIKWLKNNNINPKINIKMETDNNQTNAVINKCNKYINKYLIVMDK